LLKARLDVSDGTPHCANATVTASYTVGSVMDNFSKIKPFLPTRKHDNLGTLHEVVGRYLQLRKTYYYLLFTRTTVPRIICIMAWAYSLRARSSETYILMNNIHRTRPVLLCPIPGRILYTIGILNNINNNNNNIYRVTEYMIWVGIRLPCSGILLCRILLVGTCTENECIMVIILDGYV